MEPDNDYKPTQLPKKHPYTVPDRYFDELPMRVQQRVQRKPAFGGFSLPVLRPRAFGMALAALLVIVAGLWFTLKQATPANTAKNQVALADLTDTEVASYLTANYHQLEPADVADLTKTDELLLEALPVLEAQDLAEELDYATLEEYYL